MWPAIIAGAAAVGSSLLNFGSQKDTNKQNKELAELQNKHNLEYQDRAFGFNREMSDLEYERNLEQWVRQNEYNSPTEQMNRLSAAGLNPNMLYGSGTAAVGNASSSPQYTAPRYEAPKAERAHLTAPRFDFDPYQAVQIGQALALQKAQKDNVQAQTEQIKQTTKNTAIDELIKAVELSGNKLTLRQKEDLYTTTIDQAKESLRKTTAEVANLHHDAVGIQMRNNLSEQQLYRVAQEIKNLKQTYNVEEFKLRLLKLGITDRDNAIVRFASRILLANEDEITSFLSSIVNWFKK